MKTTLFRNMFAATVALFISMFALPQKAMAEAYDIWIAGERVTSANCNDLSVIDGVSGTEVSYNPNTKTLTLDNATINNATINATDEGRSGIYGKIDGLTVQVKGTVSVTTQSAALVFRKSATLTGGGTLNATGICGILASSTDLTLDGLTVNAKGKWGIAGENGSVETLTIRNATVTAEGNGTKGSICDFKDITLDGCAITSPAEAEFDASLKGVALNGELVKEKVVIGHYDLKIADLCVSSDNCNDLTVIPGVSGTVKYDPNTKTLTLEDATINATGGTSGIWGKIDGLTVQVKGTVSVTTQSAALVFYKSATITGGGTLNATSGTSGILADQTDLTIDGLTVNAKGEWGIAGENGSVERLTIKNATVTAEGTEGSICDFRYLSLDGCKITQPTGAEFIPTLKGVALGGELVTEKVVIQPVEYYNLWVAGVWVTSLNCNDLSDLPGVTGTVKYDPATKTLTLEDATINVTKDETGGIVSTSKDLTIQVKGTSSVTAKSAAFVFFNHPVTIEGGGTLNATSSDDAGIFDYGVQLTIEDCTVNAKGKYGIRGYDGSAESLIINNATVTAEGNGTNGSICNFKDITLDDCAITQPAGAEFDASLKGVALNGELVATKVVITRGANAIESVHADVPLKKQGTYTLHGVKLNTAFDRLPAGVYIVDGKKVVKR